MQRAQEYFLYKIYLEKEMKQNNRSKRVLKYIVCKNIVGICALNL